MATRKTAPPRPRRLSSLADAAEYAGVAPITMRRWISAGRLPAHRAGARLIRVDLNDVDDMLRPIPTVKSEA